MQFSMPHNSATPLPQRTIIRIKVSIAHPLFVVVGRASLAHAKKTGKALLALQQNDRTSAEQGLELIEAAGSGADRSTPPRRSDLPNSAGSDGRVRRPRARSTRPAPTHGCAWRP